MKKLIPVLMFTLMFIFSATVTSYAGFFNQSETNDSYSSSSNNTYSRGESSEDYGGFFRSSSAGNPGNRPGNGDGIGQDAPVGDGIPVIIACCIALGLLKFFDGGRKGIDSEESEIVEIDMVNNTIEA